MRSCNNCCLGKARSIICSFCVCGVLIIQHTKRMRCVIFSTFSEKECLNLKCVFIYSTTLSESFLILKKNSGRYHHKCTYVYMPRTRYSCQILMQFAFSRQIFEKHLNMKFNETPSFGSRNVPCGRTDTLTDRETDKHDEANSRFSQCCQSAS